MTIFIDSNVIVQRLMTAKEQRGYSQTDLAKLSGIPQPHISRLAKGLVKDPSVNTILELCQALEIDLPALFSNDAEVFLQSLEVENSVETTLPTTTIETIVTNDDIFIYNTPTTSNVFIQVTPRSKQQSTAIETEGDIHAFMKLIQLHCLTKIVIGPNKQPVVILSMNIDLRPQLIEVAQQWVAVLDKREVQWEFLDVEQSKSFMQDNYVQLEHSNQQQSFAVNQEHVTSSGQCITALEIETPNLLQDHWKQMLCMPGITQVWTTELSNTTHVIRHLRKEIGMLEMQLEQHYNINRSKRHDKESRLSDLLTLLQALETATTTLHDCSGTLIVTGDSPEQLNSRVQALRQYNDSLPQGRSIKVKQPPKGMNLQKIASVVFGASKPQQDRYHAQAVATLCPWLCLDGDFDDESRQTKSIIVR